MFCFSKPLFEIMRTQKRITESHRSDFLNYLANSCQVFYFSGNY
jgi:hypothetical protein